MSGYVDPKANTYSRIEFQSKYGTDESYEQALYQLKWPDGFKCPKCGSRHCSGHKSDPSVAVLPSAAKGLTPMAVNVTPVVTVLIPPLVQCDPSASWRIYEKCAVSLVQYLTAAQAAIQK